MRRITLGAIALLSAAVGWAQTPGDATQLSGQVRLQWIAQQSASAGPLAQADALQSGVLDLPASGATLETELRASGHGLSSIVTLRQQRLESRATDSRAWVNELYASHDGGAWQFSAGKKIVAWDVGYGFRPNDMIQQEERRLLLSGTAEGRPLLMAEHFSASTAWSWIWVNPTASSAALGAAEPALAVRAYQRDGAIDWHGFARVGAHSGASVGAALAWVASDALELHASARYLERSDSLAMDPLAVGLVGRNPWQATSVRHTGQALIGGTWTNESQFSVLAEAWWDGSALSDGEWDGWRSRNALLASLPALGVPASAAAGNLAWQADAFNASSSLRRSNLYLRLSWEHEGWQPALDLLYQPADGGRLLTAALLWKGDRVQLQGGWRVYGGPANALLMQLPTRSIAYVAATWTF